MRAEKALYETIVGDPTQVAHQLCQVTKTGAWLTVQPFTVNGAELGVQEWQDALFLKYGLDPSHLPKICDFCNATFSIFHACNCKREAESLRAIKTSSRSRGPFLK